MRQQLSKNTSYASVNRVSPLFKQLDDDKLRKACSGPNIFSMMFVGVSAFFSGRSRTLASVGDPSIVTWGFQKIDSEMCECIFEDRPECIMGGDTFRMKWIQFGPCSKDEVINNCFWLRCDIRLLHSYSLLLQHNSYVIALLRFP